MASTYGDAMTTVTFCARCGQEIPLSRQVNKYNKRVARYCSPRCQVAAAVARLRERRKAAKEAAQ